MDNFESLQELHHRYLLQAKWTAENRRRLFTLTQLEAALCVLEVGSGTGAISHEIANISSAHAFGVDIDPKTVTYAHSSDTKTKYTVGDGNQLPYPDSCFDITLCHFLLMWVKNPPAVLEEMKRVTKSGGAILALAEPDYGGRIDYPEDLEALGQQQAAALRSKGADPNMGRKLRMLFSDADLENAHVGVLGSQWHGMPDEMTISSENKNLTRDLIKQIPKNELDEYLSINQKAWSKGHRLLFVPTFYACGWNPN